MFQTSARLFGDLIALIAILVILPIGSVAEADLSNSQTLPFISSVFGDNMVLQRDAKDRIWGWTTPLSPVSLSLEGKVYTTTARADGAWIISFNGLPAGGPYTLTVKGSQAQQLSNVMFGDVWLISGQSNAGMGVKLVKNGDQEVANANYPNIRIYRVPGVVSLTPLTVPAAPSDSNDGVWQVCSPEVVGSGGWGGVSAMGYFFGRHLYKSLNVPIGLVTNAWGGQPIETFMSGESLETLPDYKPQVDLLSTGPTPEKVADVIDAELESFYNKDDAGTLANPSWASPSYDDSAWRTMTSNGWVAPAWNNDLAGKTGIIWFRVTFDAPQAWAGHDLTLNLSSVSDLSTTFVNGVKVGETNTRVKPASYTVPGSAVMAGNNVVAIRIVSVAPGPGVYGAVGDVDIALASDTSSKIALGLLPWKYKVAYDTSVSPDQPPALLEVPGPGTPSLIYNGIFAPLEPMSIKGITWYQGETSTTIAGRYRTLLPLFISDLRAKFQSGQVPFLVVQLSSVGKGDTSHWSTWWAQLREAQLLTVEHTPKTGLVVTSDIGDPTNVHYPDKQDLGDRLALAALAIAYGQDIDYSGPVYSGMTIEGSKIRITFRHSNGLKFKGDTALGFTIAGSDNKFVPADAVIDGDTVVVSSPSVPSPTAVRYGWSGYTDANLYNGADLPASQFRTDNLPLLPPMRY